MKKSITAYVVSFLVLSAACKKKDADPTLTSDKSELTLIGYTGYTDSIQVNASSAWKVEIPADVKWLEADQQEGTGNATLRFRIIKDNNASLQQATVKLTSGNVTQSLVLKQLPHYANARSIVLGGSDNDYIFSGVASPDGGFLLVGNTNSTDLDFAENTGNDENAFVVKYDRAGNVEWKRFVHDGNFDRLIEIACTPTGEFVMTGTINGPGNNIPQPKGEGDLYVEKLDRTGTSVWRKRYGGPGHDGGSTVCIGEDGSIFLAGVAEDNGGDVADSNGERDAWVMKLNSTGDIIWKKCIGGAGDDYVTKMVMGKDGNLLFCGETYSSGDGTGDGMLPISQAWNFKMDVSGTLLWSKVLGGEGQDGFSHMVITPDGGILTGGLTSSPVFNGQNLDEQKGVIVKLNSSGAVEWTYLLQTPSRGYINAMVVTKDRGYLVAGYSYDGEDAFLLLMSPSGKLLWKRSVGGSKLDAFHDLIQTTDNKLVAAGISYSNDGAVGKNNGSYDCWIQIFE